MRCSGVECHLCSFSQSLDEALFHHDNSTTMYYIIWNDIFSFFPVRFGMYISVAWYWNLYIIRWKCVWCSCAVGVILCSFYQFLDKVLFHHDNHKHQVCGYDKTLFNSRAPSQSIGLFFWVCVVLVLSVICVPLANPLMKLYFIIIIILLCIISYETKFSHSFLIGLRCIFQLPGSEFCIL